MATGIRLQSVETARTSPISVTGGGSCTVGSDTRSSRVPTAHVMG